MSKTTKAVLVIVSILLLSMSSSLYLQVQELEKKVGELEKNQENITNLDKNLLDNRLQESMKGVFKEFLVDFIYETVWKEFLHFSTIFESIDGYTVTVTGAGGVVVDPDGLLITPTGGGADPGTALLARAPNPSLGGSDRSIPYLSWKQPSAIRANFMISAVSNLLAYIVRGNDPTLGISFYGFKMDDDTLQGAVHDGTSETAIDLMTIAANTQYIVEAKYYPGDKIIFLVQNSSTKQMEELGVLNSGLMGIEDSDVDGFFAYYIDNQTTSTLIDMSSNFFEYIQKRDKY